MGVSYKDHFTLSKPPYAGEHLLPIYTNSKQSVKMYLEVDHVGLGGPQDLVIYLDSIKIPINNKIRSQYINLTSYIKKSNEMGVHVFNESFHTIAFRIKPSKKSLDKISVKVLLNVYGSPSKEK